MENISVELILLIVLGSVFVIDFVLKGLKRSSKKMEGVISFKKSSNENKASTRFDKTLQYFIDRPRNIGLFIFMTLMLKILIHFYAYPKIYTYSIRESTRAARQGVNLIKKEPFTYYVEKLFIYTNDNSSKFIFMWSISIIIISFIAWQLNPHIKKR